MPIMMAPFRISSSSINVSLNTISGYYISGWYLFHVQFLNIAKWTHTKYVAMLTCLAPNRDLRVANHVIQPRVYLGRLGGSPPIELFIIPFFSATRLHLSLWANRASTSRHPYNIESEPTHYGFVGTYTWRQGRALPLCLGEVGVETQCPQAYHGRMQPHAKPCDGAYDGSSLWRLRQMSAPGDSTMSKSDNLR